MKNICLFISIFFISFSFGQHHKNLDSLWKTLVKSDLCLTGFQYVGKEKTTITSPEIILNNTKWKNLISQPKPTITHFLILKFTDTLKTNLHTCPFFKTRNNELAVYVLQHIYGKNWYDFKEFKKFKNRDITGSDDQPQIWLQNILANKSKRKILIKSWLRELKRSSEE